MTSFVVLANGALIPSFGAASQMERKMVKKAKVQYRLAKDIHIPAGTEVDVDPPHTLKTGTNNALILIEVTKDTTAYWRMDLEEAIEEGMVEEVPADEAEPTAE